MKIVEVNYWMVRMPLTESIAWASGARTGATRLVARIETDAGIVGWGETICLIETVRAVFEKVVAELALGYDVSQVERFGRHVLGAGYYHHKRAAVMAIAALEMAMWDALGKAARQPLHALWGGLWRADVRASAYLFLSDARACADKAAWFADQGYDTFKAKIGFGEAADGAILEAVRARIGAAPLRADVNGAWHPGTAKRMLRRFESLDLAYIEQPLPLENLAGHADLRRSQPTPVALDESAYTLEDVAAIVRADAADVILLDPHEAGGLWQTIKAAAIAEASDLSVTLHSGGELGLSQAAYVHLAASIPNMDIAIDTERAYLAGDIVRNPPVLRDGGYAVPTEPGLGVEIDVEQLERYRVDAISGAYLDPARPGWFPVKPTY
ncbi:mandelate racemase/muconate lactonizing enzyme family protein [Tahibacter soli]|uniref:glucarate dehydratase n=1 Tax=Tahibacter soli TaxID=2983605 RepID=A0A9X4BKS1_9GAMM|nr:mandelate racemase/muconate lactonizing enzyme family protein [Tahibacter soli]MDC8013499.1 mandelate racemase/muconate lactonizing enzyme family protein [Tahibacter soli]